MIIFSGILIELFWFYRNYTNTYYSNVYDVIKTDIFYENERKIKKEGKQKV